MSLKVLSRHCVSSEDNDDDDDSSCFVVEENLLKRGTLLQSSVLRWDDPASCYTGTDMDTNENNTLPLLPSLGERMVKGQTLLQLPKNILTEEELESLLQSSLAAASSLEANADTNKGHQYTRKYSA
jgi:hypothetical protein